MAVSAGSRPRALNRRASTRREIVHADHVACHLRKHRSRRAQKKLKHSESQEQSPSLHSSFRLLQPVILKHLHSVVIRIHHEDAVAVIDDQPGGQAEIAKARAHLSEVIQQLSLAIEYLHHVV